MASTEDISAYEDTDRHLHQSAVLLGGCFAFVAVVLSICLTLQHLGSYTNPAEQKWTVAVIFMVPVYATESFTSLCNPRLSLVCDILRNCYEAFALYSFGSYLVACLGGERRVIEFLENESQKQLSKPLLEETDGNAGVQRRSSINFFSQPSLIDDYGDGDFKWYYGYPYIAVALNFSQMWALYRLVQFYKATHERLKPIKPLAKFISFKAIVFVTWWQGMGIALLCALGVLPNDGRIRTGLQDFLICIEMAVAAVAHIFVFSVEPYHFVPASGNGNVISETRRAELEEEEGNADGAVILEKMETHDEAPTTSVRQSIQDVVLQGDQCVVKDVVLTLNQAIGPVEKDVTKIQETFHRRSVGSEDEESKLEVEELVEENLATGN